MPAPRPERDPGLRERPSDRDRVARGPRPRRAARAQPRARQGRDELGRAGDRRGCDARRAARSARDRAGGAARRGRRGAYRSESHVPVADAEGVVTRGDLLRALHEPEGLERPLPDPEATAAVRERLGEITRLQEVLPAVERVAAAHDPVYLVGGAVRDVLLGEQSLDLDLMVGGRRARVRARAGRRAGRARATRTRSSRPRSSKGATASGNDVRIDVATARTEVYGAPGALPDVERSTLRHDMARRDFTINAMATSLRADDLGATYDFFGGFRDLRRGTVRVLHNLSFVEDPTRLLRAVRYEARLGFEMDRPHAVARARVHRDAARRRPRLGAPARRADRPAPRAAGRWPRSRAWRRSASTGRFIPGLDAGPETRALVRARRPQVAEREPFAGAVRAALVRLALLVPPDGRRARSTTGFRARSSGAATRTWSPRGDAGAARSRSAWSASAPPAPSELHEALDGQSRSRRCSWRLSARAIRSSSRSGVGSYLELVRDTRLEITGDDLKQAGAPESPAIGRALKETLALKLDGFVEGRDEELRDGP